MNKIIVNRSQALKIKDNGKCVISLNMRSKNGFSNKELAERKFLNKEHWIAEPVRTIHQKDGGNWKMHFACDPIPNDWYSRVLPRPGSRVDFGQHRHVVRCTNIETPEYVSGNMFTVFVTLERISNDS